VKGDGVKQDVDESTVVHLCCLNAMLIDEAIDLSDDLGHFETVVNRDEDGPAFGGIASSRLVYGFAELEIGNNSPEYAAATDNEAESSDRIKFWVGHEDLF
jgi:hypothetical protein